MKFLDETLVGDYTQYVIIPDTINYSFDDDGNDLNGRIRLDRRRFESAHLKYAMLNILNHYPKIAKVPITMTADIAHMLQIFTPVFYSAFCERYSGMFVLDTIICT